MLTKDLISSLEVTRLEAQLVLKADRGYVRPPDDLEPAASGEL